MSHQQDMRRWPSLRAAQRQEPEREQQSLYLDTPPPAEWMPLDEVAQAWADFGAHTHDAMSWQAISLAFAALAQEASTQRHYAALLASHPIPVRCASQPCWGYEGATSGLNEALTRWQGALLTLEAWSQQPASDEDEQECVSVCASLAQLSRWHQWRICRLLGRLYQEREAAARAQGNVPLRLHLGHLPVEEEERAFPEPDSLVRQEEQA